MQTAWDEYLKVPEPHSGFSDCHRRCLPCFESQRSDIQRVIEATQPTHVACLGAGTLNDIPYPLMVRSKSSLHLVDWAQGSMDAGIALSIIQVDQAGTPSCVYCQPALDCPEKFCKNYVPPQETSATVCRNYRPCSGHPIRCEAFDRGDRPRVHYEDATGGFAGAFGREVLAELHGIRSWKQALTRGSSLVERIARRQPTHLSIADGSVDLVTSSMVISQFEHEPYDYFSQQVAATIGPPTAQEESQLRVPLEKLRASLLLGQIQGHCREIARIMAPSGRCYMSFELFHVFPASTRWFLVTGTSETFGIIARYFHFDFDIIPPDRMLARFQTDAAPSLFCSFVLEKSRS